MALADGLVAYWKMEEANGIRYDSAPNGINLSESGGIIGVTASGVKGNAAYASGNRYSPKSLSKYPFNKFDYTTGLSISYWHRTGYYTSGGPTFVLVGPEQGQVATGRLSIECENSPPMYVRLQAPTFITDSKYISLNNYQWYHVVVRIDPANRATLFINGSAVLTLDYGSPLPFQVVANGFYLDAGYIGLYNYFYELCFDEVGLWSRPLSIDEINALYNNGQGLSYEEIAASGGPNEYVLQPNSPLAFSFSFNPASLSRILPVAPPNQGARVVNPMVGLQWSDDGGYSWSNEKMIPLGRAGETRKRMKWNRLGKARNRTFKVVMSGPTKALIADALFDAELGTGR